MSKEGLLFSWFFLGGTRTHLGCCACAWRLALPGFEHKFTQSPGEAYTRFSFTPVTRALQTDYTSWQQNSRLGQ